ncbi:MAG: aldose 1-epimerase [Ruminococcus sp.]|nr:aldose 1-epimerase [Ruminococcus sp.]
MTGAEKIIFKDTECVKLKTECYEAIICPSLGNQVLRLRRIKPEPVCEIFRYSDKVSIDTIKEAPAIWGLPTMYLPNRFDGGIIKTSDSVYKLPINEPDFGNYIHGFTYKRPFEIEEMTADENNASLTASFVYDKRDEIYKYFDVDFKMTIKFVLSDNGLYQEITLKNLSDKALPVSIATHTCINAPLVTGAKEENLRLLVPIDKKCELSERFLPTERLNELSDWDKEYKNGEKVPTGQVIENDMYTASKADFYGTIVYDDENKLSLRNEVSEEFKFFNMWNDLGDKGYFCPEPMTAMINSPNLSLDREVSGYRELLCGEEFSCHQSFEIVKE